MFNNCVSDADVNNYQKNRQNHVTFGRTQFITSKEKKRETEIYQSGSKGCKDQHLMSKTIFAKTAGRG
jgi:hypothetical protein